SRQIVDFPLVADDTAIIPYGAPEGTRLGDGPSMELARIREIPGDALRGETPEAIHTAGCDSIPARHPERTFFGVDHREPVPSLCSTGRTQRLAAIGRIRTLKS